MAVMTLAIIEAMAQAAYYVAYGEFNGAGPTFPATDANANADPDATPASDSVRMSHPYYGYVRTWPLAPLNQPLPTPRQPDAVLIALLGGSVAWQVAPISAAHWKPGSGITTSPSGPSSSHWPTAAGNNPSK